MFYVFISFFCVTFSKNADTLRFTNLQNFTSPYLHRMMLDIIAFRCGCELALRGELLAEDEMPEFEAADALKIDEPVVAFGPRVPVDTDPG